MAGADRDLLQLLANPTNRAILQLLFVEPQYPRRLAELVGITEDEASRRLRMLEKLGVAEAAWARVGKNVRLYRLTETRFSIELGAAGLRIAGVKGAEVPMPTTAEPVPETPRFVGRDVELAALDDLLTGNHAACITGIGGTGKTTLAAAWARRSGRPIVWHTVAAGESGALLLAGLASGLRAVDTPDEVRRLSALRGADESAGLARAIAVRLDALGAVAVLDRFEGASDEAAATAGAVATALTTGQILITSRVYPKGLRRDAAVAFRLGGLSVDGTRRLLAALGSTAAASDAVYKATGGHPLSVVLAVPLVLRGEFPARLGQEAGIQAFLLEDVLPQLPELEREVLLCLSVLRLPFSAEEAEAVTGSRHAVHALLRLEARSLVGRAGDRYFLHDLVRSFAAEAIPERRAVHARAAKILLASREPRKAIEAIYHFLEAGQVAQAAAVVREEAGRRTYRFAEVGLAEPYLEVVDAMARRLDLEPRLRAPVELECGAIHTHLGNAAEARPQLEACQRHLADAEGAAALRLPLQFALARLHRIEGDHDAASRLYVEVEASAQASGDRAVLLEALIEHAFDEEARSDTAALELYERAMAIGGTSADPRMLSLAFAGASRVAARWNDPRFSGWADQALELARITGYLRGEVAVYSTIATHHAMAGTPGLSLQYANKYLDAANRLGDPWMRCCALTDLSFLHTSQDDAPTALGEADQCAELAAGIHSRFYELTSAVAAGEALLAMGKPGDTLSRLEPRLGSAFRAFPGLQERGWRAIGKARGLLGDTAGAVAANRSSARLVKEHGLSTSPMAIFVAARPLQPPPAKPRRAGTKKAVAAKVFFECPQCGQVQPYPRLPKVPPQCCGNLMRLVAPPG